MGYICTVEYHLVTKEWNPVICNNMDGTEGHYVKWSKSDIEDEIPLFSLTHRQKANCIFHGVE
jgi:hypothetical protein